MAGVAKVAEELPGKLEVVGEAEVSGGYADIYRGTWTSRQGEKIEVAIKVFRNLIPKDRQTDRDELKKRMKTRIKREVFIWSQIKHPNLHPFLGYRSDPQPSLISPWCRDGNLSDYLRVNPGLPQQDRLKLIRQAGGGLEYLHSRTPPICHCDIKPENVLINDRFEAVISDFGLGRVLIDAGVPTELTTGDTTPGTTRYMARELFAEEKPRPTLQTDIYAFGGLILAVMSGKPPFYGLRGPQIVFRAMENQQPRQEDHPELSPSDPLWSLIRHCWDRVPEARPAMGEVLRELREYTHDKQPSPFSILACPQIINDNGGSHGINMSDTPRAIASGQTIALAADSRLERSYVSSASDVKGGVCSVTREAFESSEQVSKDTVVEWGYTRAAKTLGLILLASIILSPVTLILLVYH